MAIPPIVSSIAGLAAAKLVWDKLSSRSKLVRFISSIAAAAIAGAVVAISPTVFENLNYRVNPEAALAEAYTQVPELKFLVEEFPEVKAAMIAGVKSGAGFDNGVAIGQRVYRDKIAIVAPRASPAAITRYGIAHKAFIDAASAANDTTVCTGVLNGKYDLPKMSPTLRQLYSAQVQALFDAYKEGKDQSEPPVVAEEQSQTAMGAAISLQSNPFTESELKTLENLSSAPVLESCRAYAKLINNTLNLDQDSRVAVLRSLIRQ